MRERALVHVAGPASAGKTTFLEQLLGANAAFAICIRAERDMKLRKSQESAPKSHAELRRYRQAGAIAVALYRFAEPSMDAFFMSDVMQEYSEAVFIEGDCPIDYADLSVFVAPPPSAGRSLLRRVVRDHAAYRRASIEQLEQALENPEAMARLFSAGVGGPLVARALHRPRILSDLRRATKTRLDEVRRAPPPPPTEHWVLEEDYAGIEHAQLVVVNVRTDGERAAAEIAVDQITRLRTDDEVHRDVVGLRSSKVPITAVVADLLNPKDAGLKKSVMRAKRATNRRRP